MAIGKLLIQCQQWRSWALTKPGEQPKRKDHVAASHVILPQVNVKSLSDDASYDKKENISENGDKIRYLFSSDAE